MKEEVLKEAIYLKYKRSNLTKDTNYDFVFKNAKINLRNKENVILDGNINCNVFFITGSKVYSRESYFTYDNGKEVLYVSDYPILPADAFECYLSIDNEELGGFALNIFLNDKYSFTRRTNVVEDDLRHEMVAGLERLFEDNGLELCELMECVSSITPLPNKRFKNFASFEKEVKELIYKLGMDYDEETEKVSYEDLDFGTKEDFLRFVKDLSEEEFNSYLREEYEED